MAISNKRNQSASTVSISMGANTSETSMAPISHQRLMRSHNQRNTSTAPTPAADVAMIYPGMVSEKPVLSDVPVLLGAGDDFSGASYAAYLAYLDRTYGGDVVAGASTDRPLD